MKSCPACQLEGLHVAVLSSEAAAAADDPTTRARDAARSIIIVASLCACVSVRSATRDRRSDSPAVLQKPPDFPTVARSGAGAMGTCISQRSNCAVGDWMHAWCRVRCSPRWRGSRAASSSHTRADCQLPCTPVVIPTVGAGTLKSHCLNQYYYESTYDS